jgi:predicted N-acetyltransferase YhbS
MGTPNASAATSDVQVRIAVIQDAPEIMALINSAFHDVEQSFVEGPRIDMEGVHQSFEQGLFLLAESHASMVGCVYIEPCNAAQRDGARAYLGTLAVDPGQQQRGLGSLLMKAGEDYCRDLGCKFMDLRIVNLREVLPEFYRRRGYVQTGTVPFPAEYETKLPCHLIEMSKEL